MCPHPRGFQRRHQKHTSRETPMHTIQNRQQIPVQKQNTSLKRGNLEGIGTAGNGKAGCKIWDKICLCSPCPSPGHKSQTSSRAAAQPSCYQPGIPQHVLEIPAGPLLYEAVCFRLIHPAQRGETQVKSPWHSVHVEMASPAPPATAEKSCKVLHSFRQSSRCSRTYWPGVTEYPELIAHSYSR